MNSNLSILDKKDLLKFYIIIFLALIGTLFEILGVGVIVPFVIIISDPNSIQNNFYINFFFNFFSISNRENLIIISILLLVFIFTLKLVFLTFLSRVKNSFTYGVQSKISSKIFKIFLQQPYIYYSNLNSSKLIQETKDEPALYASGMLIGKIDMISEVLIILGIGCLLLYYNFLPSLIIFLIITLIVILYKFLFKKSALKWARQKKYYESLSYNILKYVYNSIIEIKINKKENSVSNKYSTFVKTGNINLAKQMFMTDVPRLYIEYIAVLIFLTFIFFAFKIYTNFNQIIPSVALYAVSAFKILPSVNRILVGMQRMNFSKNSLKVIKNLFKLEKNNFHDQNAIPIEFNRKIILRNLKFSYLSKPIINDVNLEINFGKIIGLKGSSGSGKTTLVNLILGLLDCNEGSILVDEKNLIDYKYSWQQLISYAPQKTYILDDTIKRNICFEEIDEKIDLKHLNNILTLSSLDEFINELDDGINTFIGENGSKLSGGQIQRIGFARALYKNPKLLVLDEITSSLDNKNEEIILNSIKKLSKKMTILIISHRDNALDICDEVYRLQNGKLIKEEN